MSTEWGTHSTARPSMSRASSGGSRSIAACHSFTELGTTSSALRRTRRRIVMFDSSEAAWSQILTEEGIFLTASASTALAFSGVWSRAASSQTSSLAGHALHPSRITWRALTSLPATSSRRAAAIQPGPWPGFVCVTDLSSSRAFLMSPISASVDTLIELRSVRYPFGSTTVCPETESDIWSSLTERTAPRASPMDLRSVSGVAPPDMGVSIPPVVICFGSRDVCTSCSIRAFSSSVSGVGMNFSLRLSAARCLRCSPGSGSISHSCEETCARSRLRSLNWCCSFGRTARYLSSDFSMRASRRERRRSSILASTSDQTRSAASSSSSYGISLKRLSP
mmetsp:Transcript_6129/g.13365  ORF Transcript_6129/g.13365 Transcript_6129/m.13365 type:complete len:337 (-) Transcript_6129:253-1263(-)